MMFRDMERDVFGDSGDLCPMLQGIVYCTLVRQRKDYIAVFRFAAFRQPFQRLVGDRQVKRLLRFCILISMRTRPPLCCKSLHVSFRMSLTRNPHRQLNRKACLMISCRHGVAISNFNSSIVRYSRRLGSCLTLSAKSNSFVGLIVIIPSL